MAAVPYLCGLASSPDIPDLQALPGRAECSEARDATIPLPLRCSVCRSWIGICRIHVAASPGQLGPSHSYRHGNRVAFDRCCASSTRYRGSEKSRCTALNSRSSERQQTDLRRHAQPHRKSKSPQPAIHIKRSFVRGEHPCPRAIDTRRTIHRDVIQPRHKRRDQPRRRDVVIDNLNLDLSAVRVSSQAQLNPQLRRSRKRIRIMR